MSYEAQFVDVRKVKAELVKIEREREKLRKQQTCLRVRAHRLRKLLEAIN